MQLKLQQPNTDSSAILSTESSSADIAALWRQNELKRCRSDSHCNVNQNVVTYVFTKPPDLMDLDYNQLIELRRIFLQGTKDYPLTGFQSGLLDEIDTEVRRKAPRKKDSITYEVIDNICTVTTTFAEAEMNEDYFSYMLEKAARMLKLDDDKVRFADTRFENGLTIYTISKIPVDRKVLAAERNRAEFETIIHSLDISDADKAILLASS